MTPDKITKPDQFHHENRTWIRMLEFFKQENTVLKNRLSEVLDNSTDRDFLALAEHFQNRFIIIDEYIDEMRHDINEQDRKLTESNIGLIDDKLMMQQEKLSNEMEYFEKDFNMLRNEFNKYLSKVL